MSASLETIDNPFGRLAWLIDDYLRSVDKPDESKIVQELSLFRLIDQYPDSREEQVRSYCELACTSFPVSLVGLFNDRFLFGTIQDYMKQDSPQDNDEPFDEDQSREDWVESVCWWLGFPRPPKIMRGIHLRIGHLQDSLNRLSNDRPISRQEIKGCGLDSHDTVLEILKETLSFWGRYICDEDGDYIKPLVRAIELTGRTANSLCRWLDPAQDYRLDLSDLVNLFRKWNDAFISNSSEKWVVRLKEALGENRNEFFPGQFLDLLDEIRFGRREFAHSHAPEEIQMRLPEYRKLAIADVVKGLEFANQMMDDLFPKVIVMQRRLLMEGGEIRLDYLDELGNLKHVRFLQGPIPFYPRMPIYYYQPMREEEEKATVLESAPIFMPIDETWNGEVL